VWDTNWLSDSTGITSTPCTSAASRAFCAGTYTVFTPADFATATIGSMPGELQPQVEFSEDYPENGVLYTVKRGDTLSGIARRLDSTVKDIQNANKIVDPARDLRVGDVIFVPQGSQ